MNLYLMRHGLAAEKGIPGLQHDSERPLTEEGIEKIKQAAKAMKRLDILPDWILASPYIRAKETAQIVAAKLGLEAKLKMTDTLIPEAAPRRIIDLLQKDYVPFENLLLVGHEPHLSQLISILVTGDSSADFVMKKGSLCRLNVSALRYGICASLDCLLTPKQLALMAD